MPLPVPQTLLIGPRFRDKLDPLVREEFDTLIMGLQKQIGGVGVVRALPLAEIIMTTDTTTSTWTRSASPKNNFYLTSFIGQDLLWVSLYISATSAGLPAQVRLGLPLGYRIQSAAYGEIPLHANDAGGFTHARAIFNGADGFPGYVPDTMIAFIKIPGANWANGTVNLRGQLIVPVERVPKLT